MMPHATLHPMAPTSAEREGQDHDQAANDLSQALARLEIAQGTHACSRCVPPASYCNANQNFATNVALHQRDMRPSGLVTGLMRPPGTALGSPVRTKQSSLERLVL